VSGRREGPPPSRWFQRGGITTNNDQCLIKREETVTEADQHYLRHAIVVSDRSRQRGNHPFGAILVSDRGRILLEAENTQIAASDCTGHAETNLLREASRRFTRGLLARCTLYVNAEPCPGVRGRDFWSGVGRVVDLP
jgi:tRNA(Arg) A34 adenosine deaminase TadA